MRESVLASESSYKGSDTYARRGLDTYLAYFTRRLNRRFNQDLERFKAEVGGGKKKHYMRLARRTWAFYSAVPYIWVCQSRAVKPVTGTL